MIRNRFKLSLFAIAGAFLFTTACSNGNSSNNESSPNEHQVHNNEDTQAVTVTKAISVITPTEGNDVKGTITFTQTDAGILIEADVEGLTEGKHGFHVHEFGDISKPDGTSAGGHFNPYDTDHAGPEEDIRHVGDFGNLVANENGKAHYERVDSLISFKGKENIIGRAIIIHAGEDDLVSQPTGDAGGRVGYGVVGVAELK